jgi:hypothetical protein
VAEVEVEVEVEVAAAGTAVAEDEDEDGVRVGERKVVRGCGSEREKPTRLEGFTTSTSRHFSRRLPSTPWA